MDNTVSQYGHWDTSRVGEFAATDYFGFIYEFTNITTGRKYIGKKSLWSTTSKKVNRIDDNGKKIIKVTKESDWRTYTGSSTTVNEEISKGQKFTFNILQLHKNKGALAYAEIELLVIRDVLRAKFDNGQFAYYNRAIGNMKFALKDEMSEIHKKRLSKAMIGNSNAKDGNQHGTVANHTEASKTKISQSQAKRHALNRTKDLNGKK